MLFMWSTSFTKLNRRQPFGSILPGATGFKPGVLRAKHQFPILSVTRSDKGPTGSSSQDTKTTQTRIFLALWIIILGHLSHALVCSTAQTSAVFPQSGQRYCRCHAALPLCPSVPGLAVPQAVEGWALPALEAWSPSPKYRFV